jgi:hypothetical protein
MSFEAIKMINAVTRRRTKGSQPSIKPLRDYLASGRPFNDHIRRWLVQLLSPKGYQGERLILASLPGRKTNDRVMDREYKAYQLYSELRETTISQSLLKELAAAKGSWVEFDQRDKRVRNKWIPGPLFYRIGRGRWTRFDKNKPLAADAARLIVAHRMNWSEGTLRKVLARWAKAASI